MSTLELTLLCSYHFHVGLSSTLFPASLATIATEITPSPPIHLYPTPPHRPHHRCHTDLTLYQK